MSHTMRGCGIGALCLHEGSKPEWLKFLHMRMCTDGKMVRAGVSVT